MNQERAFEHFVDFVDWLHDGNFDGFFFLHQIQYLSLKIKLLSASVTKNKIETKNCIVSAHIEDFRLYVYKYMYLK